VGAIHIRRSLSDANLLDNWRAQWRRETTFALEYLKQVATGMRFVNADLIAAGLSPLAPERELMAASRLFLQEIETCIIQAEDFAFETTLAGRKCLACV
jgi:predicted ABC-type ATPase